MLKSMVSLIRQRMKDGESLEEILDELRHKGASEKVIETIADMVIHDERSYQKAIHGKRYWYDTIPYPWLVLTVLVTLLVGGTILGILAWHQDQHPEQWERLNPQVMRQRMMTPFALFQPFVASSGSSYGISPLDAYQDSLNHSREHYFNSTNRTTSPLDILALFVDQLRAIQPTQLPSESSLLESYR